MDFTPGSMFSAQPRQPFDEGPNPMGTRARAPIRWRPLRDFEKPAADARRQSGALPPRASPARRFLAAVPTVERPARHARRMRQEVVVARRKEGSDKWYVGGITNDRPYTTEIALDFCCGPYLYDDFVRGRGECRPAGHGLQENGCAKVDASTVVRGGDGSQRRLGSRDRVAGRDFQPLSLGLMAVARGLGSVSGDVDWRKRRCFSASPFTPAIVRSAAIRFAGVRCRGRILRRLADDAGARTGATALCSGRGRIIKCGCCRCGGVYCAGAGAWALRRECAVRRLEAMSQAPGLRRILPHPVELVRQARDEARFADGGLVMPSASRTVVRPGRRYDAIYSSIADRPRNR